jgi:hypothetical protein
MAAECARADVREERRVWHAHRQPRMREQPYRLVFLDETYVNTKMTRLRGRSRTGQRLRTSAPFGHWTTHTFLAGLRCHELSAPWIIDGPITRSAFDTYVETQLAPTLAKGDVVILDNLAVLRVKRQQIASSKEAPGSCSCRLIPIGVKADSFGVLKRAGV